MKKEKTKDREREREMVTMRWWPPASGCAYRFLRDRNIKEHNEAHYRKEKKTLMSRKEAPLSLLPTYEAAQSEVINSASSLFSFSFCSTTRVPSVSKMSLSSSYLRKFFCLSVGAKGVPRRERERAHHAFYLTPALFFLTSWQNKRKKRDFSTGAARMPMELPLIIKRSRRSALSAGPPNARGTRGRTLRKKERKEKKNGNNNKK